MRDKKLHMLPFGPSGEERLLKEIKRGDAEAFEALYHRYVGLVFTIAREVLGNHPAVPDVVQETFIKVYNDIEKFRGDGRLLRWIRRIAVNTAISEVRRLKRIARNQAVFLAESPPALHHDLPELSSSVRAMLWRLEPIKRITFYLHHIEGFTGAEIAQELGESRDASLKRLQRTRLELLEMWEGDAAAETPEERQSTGAER